MGNVPLRRHLHPAREDAPPPPNAAVSGADRAKASLFLCVWPELLARKLLPKVRMRKAGMKDGPYGREGD